MTRTLQKEGIGNVIRKRKWVQVPLNRDPSSKRFSFIEPILPKYSQGQNMQLQKTGFEKKLQFCNKLQILLNPRKRSHFFRPFLLDNVSSLSSKRNNILCSTAS